MSEKPQLLSFITCDGVHFDHASGKYFLLGIFSGIRAMRFPVKHPRMYWFLSLTECAAGNHKLVISMNLPTESPRHIVKRAFNSRGPNDRIHIVNEINNMEFEQPGDYTVMVEIDDEPLLVTSFQVNSLEKPGASAQ